ncbi:MAG: response regulator transcription factor [Chloroflexi bacterium]|nr:response regulator transcription factor [Chloroflexota bacterium]
MPAQMVLVVDDEPSIVQLDRLYLEREGFAVQSAVDGRAGLQAIESLQPALVVLDLMLPELDGFEVCRRLRAANNPVPILIVTARDEDVDKIVGLELGADDYLVKPYNPRELVARVKAILRRADRTHAQPGTAPIHLGELMIDQNRHEARLGERVLDLRAQEFEVLWVLASNPNRVLNRDQLLNQAWGFDFAGQTRTVDVHIAHLRRKLGEGPVRIETVTGVGYKLVT